MATIPREAPWTGVRKEAAASSFGRTIWMWLTTVDHKKIGILYILGATFFFVLGGVEALLMRIQLMNPANTIAVGNTFNELLTMHGTTMLFFFAMPLFFGLMNIIMPLQIGARDVAFPTLNALSVWLFILGGILFHTSWLLGGAPNNGWFNYPPNSLDTFNPFAGGIDYYNFGLQLSGLGSFMTAINFIVTIVNMRAPGMTFFRMPLFTWATLITSVITLFALPPLTADLFLLMFDRLLGMRFFDVTAGGNVLIWQHLFWIFGHPEVYILALPGFGIISEVIATFSRKPIFGYTAMVVAMAAIAFLGFGVWSHHMFAVGMGPLVNSIFSATSMLIAIPTGVKVFNWIATLWGGKLEFKTALLYAVGFLPIFVLGGMTGVMVAVAPADYQYNMTYFVVAHFHYVMIGTVLFGSLAALFYWFPRIWGKTLDERLGRWSFWIVFIGFNVTFFPMHFLGLLGMPRRIYTYRPELGLVTLNQISTYGAFILTLGILLVLINVAITALKKERSVADPWDARTLEWSIPNPVPEYNYLQLPQVRARDAWWYEKRHGNGQMPPAEPLGPIHMPSPSILPFIMAVGLTIASYGAIFREPYVIWAGVIIFFVSLYRSMIHEDHGYTIDPAAAKEVTG
ncbi:MAG: cytochrome c oxidase subunit I [Clostridiales bacterium]|nr:cytochrome c oxidase subunit I [Clostridiales bacterium]